MSKKNQQLNEKNRSDRSAVGLVFEAMGPSKNAYFEDVFKMSKTLLKMSKNGPKMIPKWFKIAKLLKIAPKIRPHEDL